ncbi:putative sodium symporter protein [Alkalidesulfovibrio alkalitolerans DSM 16529]|jgi:cation/acetate symporter|uniref:Putative sodium symporter protein n=1 Tax=Alkalidesulfovibrio alkalitolerans DSM 16529 TaxID=1121439 RepID=S7TFW9_9BACT|nr:sodium:solute symporter family protein [Alkalidesulfovibrio alkalitolerans]EPR35505.1 putative sodium symporter protein [Alkalidesulfovibrio alkalitolerans DSM 16529]
MSILTWTYIIVGLTFGLYMYIAWASRVKDTKGFYVAGGGVPPLANGMATGADWMSAASFISMAGIISFSGFEGSVYLMGWTGGYVLLALLLAPYLRKFGKFTVPDFVGDRYYSTTARVVALVCAIFVSLTYVAGQMRGVGIVFSRFLEVDVTTGVVIGMCIVFLYAGLGGMKGITWTQVAQYVVLIIAFTIPAVAISMKITGNPIPQLGFGGTITEGTHAGRFLLETLDAINKDLGFAAYTSAYGPGQKSMIDVLCITLALMVGTAGLPHVIVRFYTVPTVRAARLSAGYALLFIAILYTTAPAVAGFARYNMVDTLNDKPYAEAPQWFKDWEKTGLVAWVDKNGDGIIQYRAGDPFKGRLSFTGETGPHGQPLVANAPTDNENELYVDRDIMVLANPQIANLPAWVVALVAAGGLAAALSTASGLLLVVASSISHDLYYRVINRKATEKQRLRIGRIMIGLAVLVAGYFGINPPGFVAQVVALAFGLAASSFFPILVLGIFSNRVNREGAIAGMIAGIGFTMLYIVQTKFMGVSPWFFGISPEGIGAVGMCLNFVVTWAVSAMTPPPPQEIRDLVESVRIPKGAGAAVDH